MELAITLIEIEIMQKRYIFMFTFLLLVILLFPFFIVVVGHFESREKSDLCVVLGNKVYFDGTPSPWLKGRLDQAVQLYSENKVKYILVSGATDQETGVSEAKHMRSYLIEQGIPPAYIWEDSLGNNTFQTIMNTRTLLGENNLKSVKFVSQFYHTPRIRYAASRAGIPEASFSFARYYCRKDIYATLRECIALPYYAFKNYS